MGRAKLFKSAVVSFFMDGSKLIGRVAGGNFFREISINSSFRLTEHCNDFQVKMAAIKVSLDTYTATFYSLFQRGVHFTPIAERLTHCALKTSQLVRQRDLSGSK